MAKDTITRATFTEEWAAFFKASPALAVTVNVADGDWAVLTRSGVVIPAASEEEANHILSLAGQREVREASYRAYELDRIDRESVEFEDTYGL